MNEPQQGTREAYEAWHQRFPVDRESDSPWHRLVKKHLSLADDVDGRRVLEIGCGRGGFSLWLLAQQPTATILVAADFSSTALTKARDFVAAQREGTPARWVMENIEHLPHPTGSFDTVISCETIEHVPHPRQAIAELARVLRPGGRLFLTTPNYLGPMGLYRIYLRARGRRFTEEGQPLNQVMLLPRTCAWVRAAGLRIVHVDSTGHYIPFPGRPPIEVPALGHPRRLMRWFALHPVIVALKP